MFIRSSLVLHRTDDGSILEEENEWKHGRQRRQVLDSTCTPTVRANGQERQN